MVPIPSLNSSLVQPRQNPSPSSQARSGPEKSMSDPFEFLPNDFSMAQVSMMSLHTDIWALLINLAELDTSESQQRWKNLSRKLWHEFYIKMPADVCKKIYNKTSIEIKNELRVRGFDKEAAREQFRAQFAQYGPDASVRASTLGTKEILNEFLPQMTNVLCDILVELSGFREQYTQDSSRQQLQSIRQRVSEYLEESDGELQEEEYRPQATSSRLRQHASLDSLPSLATTARRRTSVQTTSTPFTRTPRVKSTRIESTCVGSTRVLQSKTTRTCQTAHLDTSPLERTKLRQHAASHRTQPRAISTRQGAPARAVSPDHQRVTSGELTDDDQHEVPQPPEPLASKRTRQRVALQAGSVGSVGAIQRGQAAASHSSTRRQNTDYKYTSSQDDSQPGSSIGVQSESLPNASVVIPVRKKPRRR